MRIKSYFASSVQSAIALVRREFGDDVTLVTSHVASPETRHLGEYEVVFAIDEAPAQPAPEPPAAVLEPEAPKPAVFQEVLSEAITTTPSTRQNLPERLEALRCTFIELGIEPPIVRALMTLIESHVSAESVSAEPAPDESTEQFPTAVCPVTEAFDAVFVAPEPMAAAVIEPAPLADIVPPKGRLSAAELAFISSVSSAPAAFAAAHGARS